MNDPIEEQRQLIDKLYQIVKVSAPDNATSAKCEFEYWHGFDDGSSTVNQAFSYFLGKDEVSELLHENYRDEVTPIVKALHAKMKAHTGGD